MAWSHVSSEGNGPLNGQFVLSLHRRQLSHLCYFVEEGHLSSKLDYFGPYALSTTRIHGTSIWQLGTNTTHEAIWIMKPWFLTASS